MLISCSSVIVGFIRGVVWTDQRWMSTQQRYQFTVCQTKPIASATRDAELITCSKNSSDLHCLKSSVRIFKYWNASFTLKFGLRKMLLITLILHRILRYITTEQINLNVIFDIKEFDWNLVAISRVSSFDISNKVQTELVMF